MESVEEALVDVYVDNCSPWLKISIDVFVIVKAIVLTWVCVSGILWFKNKKYNSFPVICTLIVSLAIVSENFDALIQFSEQVISELAYRFTDRNLRYRFFQNAIS